MSVIIIHYTFMTANLTKKSAAPFGTAVIFLLWSKFASLSLLDCVVGAYRCATAAADASIRIDVIDLALGDCLYRAYRNTGTAGYAAVSNYISHCYSL